MDTILNAASELYLGTDRETAMALGPRQFRTAAKAVRFAMEQAAPVSLRGAVLRIGALRLGPAQIAGLYRDLPARDAEHSRPSSSGNRSRNIHDAKATAGMP